MTPLVAVFTYTCWALFAARDLLAGQRPQRIGETPWTDDRAEPGENRP